MLVIRLARVGRKNKPQFRLVVQEHTANPTGKHTEIVGSWDPSQKKGVFKNERIEYWLSQGAKASDTVHNLLVSQEVIKADKRKIKITKKKSKEEEGKEDSSKSEASETPKDNEAPKAEEGGEKEEKSTEGKKEEKEETKEEAPAEKAKEETQKEEKREETK